MSEEKRHPAAAARDEFEKKNPQSYSRHGIGDTDRFLKNRLDHAFQAGWDACASAALRAVGGEGGRKDG